MSSKLGNMQLATPKFDLLDYMHQEIATFKKNNRVDTSRGESRIEKKLRDFLSRHTIVIEVMDSENRAALKEKLKACLQVKSKFSFHAFEDLKVVGLNHALLQTLDADLIRMRDNYKAAAYAK